MEGKMDKVKNTLIIGAYVLLMVLFFFGGYAMGGIRKGDIALSATPKPGIIPAAAVNPVSETESVRYKLLLDNSELLLYKLENDTKELLYSHPISENIFPSEDMEELRRGVYFESLSEAQSLLENFVS